MSGGGKLRQTSLALQSGILAFTYFQKCQSATNPRERLRLLYEAERLRAEAVAHALLSPNFETVLDDLARLLDAVRDSAGRRRKRG